MQSTPTATRSPVRAAGSPTWFYDSPAQTEALARLDFIVEARRPCGLVVGAEGTGKSLLLERLLTQLQRSRRDAARIDLLGAGSEELLWELAAALQLSPAAGDTAWQLWRAVADHLRGMSLAGLQSVLLFDHFDRAQPGCERTFARLLACARGTTGCITIVVAVRSAAGRAQRALAELCDVRIDLPPLERHETAEYARNWLRHAGASQDFFDPAAVDQLHERSHGVPRVLNRLCELALLAATSERRDTAPADVVAAVAAELALA